MVWLWIAELFTNAVKPSNSGIKAGHRSPLKTHTIQIRMFWFSFVLLFRFRSPKAKNVCTKVRQVFCWAVLSDFESTPELLENGLLIRLTGTDILYWSVKCVTRNSLQKYSNFYGNLFWFCGCSARLTRLTSQLMLWRHEGQNVEFFQDLKETQFEFGLFFCLKEFSNPNW